MFETSRLTLAVANRTLCRDLSVRFAPGENWVILGANGSGKTTLLHALAGLYPPAGGEVRLDDKPLPDIPHRQRAQRIGVLLQDYDAALPASVLEVVLTGRHPHLGRWQWEDESDRRIAEDALAAVELTGFATRSFPTLSGGERRRAEIAALLAQDAPLCLLDEPTNHLDLQHQVRVLERLSARARRPGHLNVIVLHDVNLASRFGTHGILLFGDGDSLHGPLPEILRRDALERLYRCRLRELRDGNRVIFLPD
ncbi:MAG: ABC transporter ATP-binding protein [Gammaproteobacteria bacterium]|nr:ABC transporter ATP-binding protein [Gammaproteobacteria bacterium]